MSGHTPWRVLKEGLERRKAEREAVRAREARVFWDKVMSVDPLELPKALARERGLEMDVWKGSDAKGSYRAFIFWLADSHDHRTWTSDFVYLDEFMGSDKEISIDALDREIHRVYSEGLRMAEQELVPRSGDLSTDPLTGP